MRHRFPDGDWFRACGWQQSALYQRNPAVVEQAMESLAKLIDATWFANHIAISPRVHPLCLGIFHSGPLTFWPTFKVGYDLATVGPIPQRFRARLLHLEEARGALAELSAAAALARHGIEFDWFPAEGGEFRINDSHIRYVEVKKPASESERTRSETQELSHTYERLSEAVAPHLTAFYLRPDLCDDYTSRQRADLNWNQIVETMISTARAMITEHDVPSRREHAFGSIYVARTEEEMSKLGAGGFSGLYLDDHYEAKRVIRSCVNEAIQQLSTGAPSLIYIDCPDVTDEFAEAVHRRLSRLSNDDSNIAAVIIRHTVFTNDIVPTTLTQLIENPHRPGVAAQSRVTQALLADDATPLRTPITQQGSLNFET